MEKYYASEGDVIERDESIALAYTEQTTFDIVSNYRGRVLKTILTPNMLVGFRDPIATLELLQDPVDGLLIEYSRVQRKSSNL